MTQAQLILVVKIEVLMAQVLQQLILLNLIQMYRLTLNIIYQKIVKVFLDKDGTFRAVEGASALSSSS